MVVADLGTSVYSTPGILYGNVLRLAGFFVLLTMSVFVLRTLKYEEVTHRFPQGGGVVTVAAQALNHWVGALGVMLILVDSFLTAALSCLSGMLYYSEEVSYLRASNDVNYDISGLYIGTDTMIVSTRSVVEEPTDSFALNETDAHTGPCSRFE